MFMKRGVWSILAFIVALQCVGIFDHTLWTPDEPRVAEIAREMAVSGDYLIPHFAYEPFLEKPPLYFATAGMLYSIFTTANEGAGRLASVLFALGTLVVIFFAAHRLFSEEIALTATLVLASSIKFFEISHKMEVDIALVFFITAAMVSFLLAHQEKLRHGYLLFWICCGLAFMSKGIIGLAIPGVAVALFVLWQKKYSFMDMVRHMRLIPGVLVVAGVMALWAWALYLRGGIDFIDIFYNYNQFGRLLGTGYGGGHVRPFYYYLPTVLADAAPWSVLMIPALIRAKIRDDSTKLLLAWFLGGFMLLSLSTTKRGLYFLPMFPAMAMLIALWMERLANNIASGWERWFLWFVALLVVASSLVLPGAYVKTGGAWSVSLGMFVITSGLFWLVLWRFRAVSPLAVCVSWVVLLLVWSPVFIPRIDAMKSYKPFFSQAGAIVNQESVVGYQLTETVEALSPFYGEFFTKNTNDKEAFEQEITSGDSRYVMVLPSRLDEGLRSQLASSGQKVLETSMDTLKSMQLWRMNKGVKTRDKEEKRK